MYSNQNVLLWPKYIEIVNSLTIVFSYFLNVSQVDNIINNDIVVANNTELWWIVVTGLRSQRKAFERTHAIMFPRNTRQEIKWLMRIPTCVNSITLSKGLLNSGNILPMLRQRNLLQFISNAHHASTLQERKWNIYN